MTSNVVNHYKRVAQVIQELTSKGANPQCVHITSLEVPEREIKPGIVCEASLHVAAACIASRTHRESTPEEIVNFQQLQADRSRECAILSAKNKERTVLTLSPELASQLGIVPPPQSDEAAQPSRRTR